MFEQDVFCRYFYMVRASCFCFEKASQRPFRSRHQLCLPLSYTFAPYWKKLVFSAIRSCSKLLIRRVWDEEWTNPSLKFFFLILPYHLVQSETKNDLREVTGAAQRCCLSFGLIYVTLLHLTQTSHLTESASCFRAP